MTDICPSLVAEVCCPADLDCNIRVNVYYSSNLTGGKDIVLCGATFSLRDLLSTAGVLTLDMTSDHTMGSRLQVETVKPLPPVLIDAAMSLTAATSHQNPLSQNFVFYNEEDNTT